jgi:hypothetical protein
MSVGMRGSHRLDLWYGKWRISLHPGADHAA